ncbi:hypothetical protein K456DRAFT_1753004 [Colletotrichum gloeosporioides 23]|nr:hypothetical protein K456DRAFT_1753004 [Colletotrichum gloeosporioides 23]
MRWWLTSETVHLAPKAHANDRCCLTDSELGGPPRNGVPADPVGPYDQQFPKEIRYAASFRFRSKQAPLAMHIRWIPYPNNISIKAIEIYIPGQALDQSLFKQYQGVSAGKYTIGLGLKYMNFCNDYEDATSLALTAVSSLLKNYNINPKSIGRLEVGTESLINKAKSIKTVLTQLFKPAGNTSLEGINIINACYGGTTSSQPTSSAGCIAMLVSPNAVLSLNPALKGTFITHTYDFYKPNLKAEFPVVNRHNCYNRFRERVKEANVKANSHSPKTDTHSLLDIFNYIAFYTPNCKLVPAKLHKLSYEDSLKSKELEKLFVTLSKNRFKSLYYSLISLISNINLKDSVGKIISMFSYGSRIASTLFALKIDIMDRLSQRKISTPEEYEEACALRLKAYGAKSFEPSGSIKHIAPGTYYLKEINKSYRRTYVVKE